MLMKMLMKTPTDLSPPKSISVTKVRLAFECPRLMYLGHHFKAITLFKSSSQQGGQQVGLGTAFHQLCDACVAQICSDEAIASFLTLPASQLQPKSLAQQLQQQLYRSVFYPYLQKALNDQPSQAISLNELWQGLKGLICRWAELLVSNCQFCDPLEVTRKTFLAQELWVSHEFKLPGGDRQLVRGKCDSLVYDFAQQRLCVVEYKTYQAIDPAAQLAQVALYSYMLQQKIGVSINSAVYSVLPDWKGVEYSWDQLEETLHQLIPPKLQQMRAWMAWQPSAPHPPPMTAHARLCDICPQYNRCHHDFQVNQQLDQQVDTLPAIAPPLLMGSVGEGFTIHPEAIMPLFQTQPQANSASSVSPAEPVKTSAADPMAQAMAAQLVETLQSFGVGTDYVGEAIGPAFIRIKLKPQLGVRVSNVLKCADDLRVHLGLENPPLIAPQAGYISVDLPRPDRQTAFFDDYFNRPQQNQPTAKAAIGVNLDGQLIEADLSDPNTCHLLVGGTTGSGKSEFLRSLLLSLIVRHDPQHFQVALVDPKRVTFPEFETMPWLYEPIVKTKEDAIALMERLVAEMDERYRRFERDHCSDLASYNQAGSQILPRILCIFDEYADFMADKEAAKALEQSIQRLGAMARAAGIHLVIATQRPEARVVTPLIRSNLPGRVALRTASDADSAIILGGKEGAAANLLGKGDLFYSGGGVIQRLQSLFVPVQVVARLICDPSEAR
jgi:S-DNA-T family DNA segregation ATPase FtsK/SpoIIIE